MLFSIDPEQYELVDLSMVVTPNQMPADRPFEIREGRLPDNTWKFDIVNTHTHVGTHIESPWHFYGRGHTCTDYPLEKFMGSALRIRPEPDAITGRVEAAALRSMLEPRRASFRNLLIQNATDHKPLRFSMECAGYLAQLRLDLLIFEPTIEFGHGIEDGRRFHDLLMSNDTLLVEFPGDFTPLKRDAFFVFAAPLRIKGLDSSPCRLFAVVEK